MKSLGRGEIVKKAMWLYPKVSGFSPSERWGHSTCCYNGVVYKFGVEHTSYDNSQWSAEIRQESTDSTDTVNKADVQLGVGTQLTNCLEDILMQTNVKKIYLQDLLNLQQLIRHLEENPTC